MPDRSIGFPNVRSSVPVTWTWAAADAGRAPAPVAAPVPALLTTKLSEPLNGTSSQIPAIVPRIVVGLARVVLTRREHVVMLEPFDKGLLATTLRYPYEIRDHAEYFEDIPDLKLPAEMKKLAAHIVETKAGRFEPKSFEDHYEKALVDLLKDKEAGKPIQTVGEERTAPRVINLMDALRASIDASARKPAAASTGARRPAKKKTQAR